MSGKVLRFFAVTGCAAVWLSLVGCAMVTDLISPNFLATLGIDPATVIQPQGRVIIAFQNSTIATTDFGATVASSVAALATDPVYVYARDVAPDETRMMVVECPVAAILPSAPIGGSELTAVGSGTRTSGQTTETVDFALAYQGAVLQEGLDFECGDVIEVRVVQTGGGTDTTIAVTLQVQVLAGR
jgi:hypothetical protein